MCRRSCREFHWSAPRKQSSIQNHWREDASTSFAAVFAEETGDGCVLNGVAVGQRFGAVSTVVSPATTDQGRP